MRSDDAAQRYNLLRLLLGSELGIPEKLDLAQQSLQSGSELALRIRDPSRPQGRYRSGRRSIQTRVRIRTQQLELIGRGTILHEDTDFIRLLACVIAQDVDRLPVALNPFVSDPAEAADLAIQNCMVILSGYLQLVEPPPGFEDMWRMAWQAVHGVARNIELNRKFRWQAEEVGPVLLGPIVGDVVEMAERASPGNLRLRRASETPEMLCVEGRPIELRRAVFGLFNALDSRGLSPVELLVRRAKRWAELSFRCSGRAGERILPDRSALQHICDVVASHGGQVVPSEELAIVRLLLPLLD